MSTAFQWIIDNAVDVQINKRGVVATTTSRDQTIRSVSRGGRVWRFTVTPNPGTRWQDPGVRKYLEELDKADRIETQYINFNSAGLEYIFGYQGGIMAPTVTIDVVNNSGEIIAAIVGSPPSTNGYWAKAGDLLQLTNTGRVYTVLEDKEAGVNPIITLNRPIAEPVGTYNTARFGKACTWKVFCTSMPYYKITPTGIIEWSGSFEFVESLL